MALLLVVWWCLRTAPRWEQVPAASPRPRAEENRAAAQLAELPAPGTTVTVPPLDGPDSERTAAPSAPDSATHAHVRGRLVIAPGSEPLAEVLRLRLRNGDVSLVEDLASAQDGTFASTRSFPRGLLLLKVFRPGGDLAIDAEAPFDPGAPEEWVVHVPWPTFVHGIVLDRRGQALRGAEIELVPRGDALRLARGLSRQGGEFRVDNLQPGEHVLHVRRGLETCAFEIDVRRGPNELGPLRTALSDEAGEINGRLLAEDGEPEGLLMLQRVGDERGVVSAEEARTLRSTGETSFRFEGVPPGEYRLRLLAADGRRYEPDELLVSPPATGIEFRAVGAGALFSLRALDGNGEELDTFGLARLRGQWLCALDPVPHEHVDAWVLLSPGRRPRRGGVPAQGELRLALEPGHGQAYLFSEAGFDAVFANGGGVRGRVLAGVEVWADGRRVARSDEDGLALVDLERAPGTVEFRLRGWRTFQERTTSQVLTMVTLVPE